MSKITEETIYQIINKIKSLKKDCDRAISEDELKILGMKEAYQDCLDIINSYLKD